MKEAREIKISSPELVRVIPICFLLVLNDCKDKQQ